MCDVEAGGEVRDGCIDGAPDAEVGTTRDEWADGKILWNVDAYDALTSPSVEDSTVSQ